MLNKKTANQIRECATTNLYVKQGIRHMPKNNIVPQNHKAIKPFNCADKQNVLFEHCQKQSKHKIMLEFSR